MHGFSSFKQSLLSLFVVSNMFHITFELFTPSDTFSL